MDLGDRLLNTVVDFKFTTVAPPAPTTLAGTPALAVYPINSTTEITAGITLTVDFDGRTGLNHVRIDLSASASYTRRQDYCVVITTGTVGGVSAVGYVVATFSIENRYTPGLVTRGICPTSGSHTTTAVVLPSSISYDPLVMNGKVLDFRLGTNAGSQRGITSWNNTTKVAIVDPALPVACDNTSDFDLLSAPPSATTHANTPLVRVTTDSERAIAAEALFTFFMGRGHRAVINGSNVELYDTDGTTLLTSQPFTRLGAAANPISSHG